MSRVLITGATGFVGSHVVERIPPRFADEVAIFARPSSPVEALAKHAIEIRRGNLDDEASVRRAMSGIDVLVNVASLGFGHAPTIVSAAREAGVRRAVFVSTTAIFTTLPAATKPVRLEAERVVRESGLAFTILRPTMIYGTPRDRNIWRLIQFLEHSPVVPAVGSGERLLQPVFVEDIAQAVWDVLDVPATIGGAFNIPGASPLTFRHLIHVVSEQLGRRVTVIPVPIRFMLLLARFSRSVPFGPRLTDEQVLRLDEDKAFDAGPAARAFGYDPVSFPVGIARELRWRTVGEQRLGS